jgi:predicted naringenin-chalcone synthase
VPLEARLLDHVDRGGAESIELRLRVADGDHANRGATSNKCARLRFIASAAPQGCSSAAGRSLRFAAILPATTDRGDRTPMYIRGLGTATPPARYTKSECLEAFHRSDWFARLDSRSHLIARTVLQRDNGIEARRLALASLDEVFAIDPDTLERRFLAHAPRLAAEAATRALAKAKLAASQIDAVVVSTCTGYVCPGLSGHVVERLGLRADLQAYDLVGQGCAAALPNLQLGRSLLASGAAEHVLSVCVEVSSAAMYLDNDPGVLISACLFGDGAGAAVLSRSSHGCDRRVEWKDGASLIEPARRAALMFEKREGMLRNILTREVPVLAADYAHRVLETVLGRARLDSGDIAAWIMHAGGRDVLLALERRFELDREAFRYSAAMLREYGNLSSAFVYFVLEAALADAAPGGWWWLSSFGAGFSCHGALLRVD